MENHFIVTSSGMLYDLFYNLAFILSLAILLFEGYKRKLPILKWIFLLLIIRFLFIAGTKLITFSAAEWNTLLSEFRLPETQQKSVIGGLLLGGTALLAGIYLLKFKKNITDAFAFAIPAAMAIQRIGCFYAGCCHGNVSHLPWAVEYPENTLAHFHHFTNGLVNHSNHLSLPVHPVQLYQVVGLLFITALLFYFRKRLRAPGNLFLLSVILIFTLRITIEFFRDTNAHSTLATTWGPFNTTQLLLFSTLLLLAWVLLAREKTFIASKATKASADFSLQKAFVLLTGFSFVLFALKNWFGAAEMLAILMTLLLAIGILAYRVITRFYFSSYRWYYLAACILPLFLMAQTFPSKSDSTAIQTYRSIKLGAGNGNFVNATGSGCGDYDQAYLEQDYTLLSTGYEYTRINPDKKSTFKYGGDLTIGKHTEKGPNNIYNNENTLFSISPYLNYNLNVFELGLGFHLGNLSYIHSDIEGGSENDLSGSKTTAFVPRLYARIGPQRWFFVDYAMAHNFPLALPGFKQQLGIGTGLGTRNGTRLRFGSDLGYFTYLGAYIPINNKLVLQPMFLWSNENSHLTDVERQFSLGLSYRFGHNEKQIPK